MKELKESCQKQGNAVMAKMKSNGDVFIYVNPQATDEELGKSMMILTVNVLKHIE